MVLNCFGTDLLDVFMEFLAEFLYVLEGFEETHRPIARRFPVWVLLSFSNKMF